MTKLLLMLLFALQAPGSSEFARLRSEWARNLHEKHVEASVASYAPDADFLSPDGTRVHGTSALRELYRTVTTTFDSDIAFTSLQLEQSGDLAYDSGTYQETLITRATQKSQQLTGGYLTVYRRSKDGNWLIVQQMWTTNSGK